MRRLGDLDFAHESAEFVELHPGRRSRIRDVRELQEAFRRLSRGTEAFARFVPETVVRNIIHGDTTATELHVSRRQVTIMNSDIEGFTAISENLAQRDLLFVLTRYLSVMTRVVELYDGVVSEIQGDGLIVFWNAPDDVEDHASKACAAALAQQHAVGLLNAEFATLDLPHLAVRIGVHTGSVMSGNIGSESKMKFGCLGEPMKVAGNLQEFCKPYGARIICSADTYEEMESGKGFFCRRLDLLPIKRSEATTWIYEVVGRDTGAEDEHEAVETHSDSQASGRAASSLKPMSSVVSEAIRRSTSSLVDPRAQLWQPIRRWIWKSGSGGPTLADEASSVPADDAAAAAAAAAAAPGNALVGGSGAAMCGNAAADATATALEAGQASGAAANADIASGESGAATAEDKDDARPRALSGDVITADQRRRRRMYEEAIDAFHDQRFDDAQRLAETLLAEVDDSAAYRLAERARASINRGGSQREEFSDESDLVAL